MKKILFSLFIFIGLSVGVYPIAWQSANLVQTGGVATANYATNAGLLNSKDSAYYTNASNLSAGIVPEARLTGITGIGVSGNFTVTNNTHLFSITPTNHFNFQNVGGAAYMQVTAYGTGDNAGTIVGRASNSATAVLSTTLDGRKYFDLIGQGVPSNNAFFVAGGSMSISQDGAAETGSVCGKFQFFTRTAGDGYTEKLTIRHNGYVGISQPTPNGTLELNGTLIYTNSTAQSLSVGSQISANLASVTVAGNGGAIDLTSNPQIATPNAIGQQVRIWGSSDTNTVKLDTGNGLLLSGGTSFTLGLNDCIQLEARSLSPVIWAEVARSNN